VLKEKGLMRISLYSQMGRRKIKPYQDQYSTKNIKDFNAEIKEFRNNILKSNQDLENFISFSDFFNSSELRDLIFHYKEHQFTIPKIKSVLNDLNLSFIGFEDINNLKNSSLHKQFKNFFRNNENILDLDNWHIFENSHKDIFKYMYQFWVQKN